MDTSFLPVMRKCTVLWPLLMPALLLSAPQSRAQNPPPSKTDPLDLYAAMTHKTILHGALPRLPDSLVPRMLAGTNEATVALKEELSKLGYNLVPDGEKFMQILPVSEGINLHSAPRFHNAGATNDKTVADQTLDFPMIDLNTFLGVFTGIINRTVLRPATLPMVIVGLHTTTPLTHEELNYAMGVVLALNGFTVVEDGTKFAWIVPASDIGLVHANAPKPEPDAALIDPANVPAVRPAFPGPMFSPPAGAAPPPPAAPATLDDLMAFYAKQQGRTFQTSPQSANQNFLFAVQTPLTKAELLYAIDSTLALNNLAIVPVDDHTFRLGKLSELHPPAKQP